MIERLIIHNFKCFEALSLPLAPLTLMTGFNAAGKSTALQALLLLAQSIREGGANQLLSLNGSLVRLGTPGDVILEGSGTEIKLGIGNANTRIDWILTPKDRLGGHALAIKRIEWQTGFKQRVVVPVDHELELNGLLPKDAPEFVQKLCAGLKETIFLSAVRVGAEDVFPSPDESEPVWADVGSQGDYAAWWFERGLDEDVDPLRLHSSEISPILRRQFNAWADELFPGAQANAQHLGSSRLIQLELRNDENEWRKPTNIGYGLSYAFPILVAGLLAKPGQILVIDSPEAHLHPMGQSKMGFFLGVLAASGVQILIETHSDHVLNGVRLAINQGKLLPTQAAIHFFNPRPRSSDEAAHVMSPQIDKNGNLSEWPSGFFDQAEKDLSTLAGWS
ncbi:MAG: DUF3696 domain-containing protein [Methylobacter sp.]|nr:MAG: DUF3696 domain-containing protein [Methylobacter sp.]